MSENYLDELKNDLSIQAKNGIDFITAATILWGIIGFIWFLELSSYTKSIGTFMVSGIMLPMAFMFSKVFKTHWKIPGNPLQPLGLWLNLAQLFYFPFLIFVLLKMPDYFVMTYAIITGAHFFPYGWFYKEISYVIVGGLIAIGSLLIGLSVAPEMSYTIPLFTMGALFVLGLALRASYKSKEKVYRLTSK